MSEVIVLIIDPDRTAQLVLSRDEQIVKRLEIDPSSEVNGIALEAYQPGAYIVPLDGLEEMAKRQLTAFDDNEELITDEDDEDDEPGGKEYYYRDENGKKQDAALWDAELGADDEGTWDPSKMFLSSAAISWLSFTFSLS